MRKLVILALTVLLVTPAAHAGAGSTHERLARFLAGCEVLHAAAATAPEHKAAALRWLVEDTGLTPSRAVALIDSYRKRPEQWARVVERVKELLDTNIEKDTK